MLNNVNLSLTAGKIAAVVGPNAAGKSTLMKCILGLVRPDQGSRIVVLGQDIAQGESYRQQLGYMPQGARFPDQLSGAELLTLLKGVRGGTVDVDEDLIRDFDLEPFLRQPIRSLSGGTKQKLNAAVALLFRPRVILLDEPTAGLDPYSSQVLIEKVRTLAKQGATVLLTSHILQEVEQLADEIVYLAEGEVRFAGSIPQLLEQTGESAVERALGVLHRRAA